MLWSGAYAPKVQLTLTAIIVVTLLGLAAVVRHRVVVPLQTIANLLAALREGDYSIRGRTADPDDCGWPDCLGTRATMVGTPSQWT